MWFAWAATSVIDGGAYNPVAAGKGILKGLIVLPVGYAAAFRIAQRNYDRIASEGNIALESAGCVGTFN